MNEPDVTTEMPDDVRLRVLMVGYQAGDLAAFDQLYAAILPAVRGFLRRKAADAERASDLTQEVFLQLHRARHTYDPAYPAMPWVMAIARHVWLMHCRASGRRPHATEAVDEIAIAVPADAAGFVERADVRAALASLSPDRRRPIVWHHVLGFSFREIAARLGIREDAAKLRSSRGMSELREKLKGTHSRDDADE